MKKTVFLLLVFALLSTSLAGCGMDRMGSGVPAETPYVSPEILPEISPMISPDMEDGVVEDRDGIISKNEESPVESTSVPQESAVPSASPRVSDKP